MATKCIYLEAILEERTCSICIRSTWKSFSGRSSSSSPSMERKWTCQDLVMSIRRYNLPNQWLFLEDSPLERGKTTCINTSLSPMSGEGWSIADNAALHLAQDQATRHATNKVRTWKTTCTFLEAKIQIIKSWTISGNSISNYWNGLNFRSKGDQVIEVAILPLFMAIFSWYMEVSMM